MSPFDDASESLDHQRALKFARSHRAKVAASRSIVEINEGKVLKAARSWRVFSDTKRLIAAARALQQADAELTEEERADER